MARAAGRSKKLWDEVQGIHYWPRDVSLTSHWLSVSVNQRITSIPFPKGVGRFVLVGWSETSRSAVIQMIYSLLQNGNTEPGSQIAMFVCKSFFHIHVNFKRYKANTISNHVHIVWRFNTPITLKQLQVQSLPPAGEIQATTKTQHYFQQLLLRDKTNNKWQLEHVLLSLKHH